MQCTETSSNKNDTYDVIGKFTNLICSIFEILGFLHNFLPYIWPSEPKYGWCPLPVESEDTWLFVALKNTASA